MAGRGGGRGLTGPAGSDGSVPAATDAGGTAATGASGTGFVTGDSGPGTAHGHAFTGTAPTRAVAAALESGNGFTTVGQVVTTTPNHTATLNQYAGCWLLTATGTPCMIDSHPAVTGAPLALTVFGEAPATAAEDYRILAAPTPAGTLATESSHTHPSGTLSGPSHTHTGPSHTHAITPP